MLKNLQPYTGEFSTTETIFGVYILNHVKTGKRYVGSSGKIGTRLSSHKSLLQKSKHHCKPLQDAYNDDPDYYVTIYTTTDREAAYDLEQAFMDMFFEEGILFNTARDARASWRNRIVTDEERERVGNQNRGKKFSPEWCSRISESLTGKKLSAEHRKKIGDVQRGVPLSKEAREKIDRLNQSRMKHVSCDGVIYKGLIEAGAATGLGKEGVRNRVRSRSWPTWFYVSD